MTKNPGAIISPSNLIGYHTRTLVRLLRQLNSWEWPAELYEDAPLVPRGTNDPRRQFWMREIEHVIAWRVARKYP